MELSTISFQNQVNGLNVDINWLNYLLRLVNAVITCVTKLWRGCSAPCGEVT